MTTTKQAILKAAKQIQPNKIICVADKGLGRFEAEILLAYVIKKDRSYLLAHPDYELPAISYKRFSRFVERRKKHEPMAYIKNERDFYGRKFFVDKRVLIPRPESEMLVELAINEKPDLVWDVGTGSGAISISIAKEIKPLTVLATDTSSPALTIARKNAKRLKAPNVTFLKSDLLDRGARSFIDRRKPKRLVIVANLPYLPNKDKQHLDQDVVKYEPVSALFGGPSGLEVIKKF
ncbi:peptide chain release factor N(5)-glutamine methyltransferase, partial [Patescibacteria group bacterium]|nr:peptide chain release factor N(5)-glutamine methyltransferase [Patescibacteria group bacterium]